VASIVLTSGGIRAIGFSYITIILNVISAQCSECQSEEEKKKQYHTNVEIGGVHNPYKWYQSQAPELAMMDESSECQTKRWWAPNHDVIHGSTLLDRRCAPDASWTCPDPNTVKRS